MGGLAVGVLMRARGLGVVHSAQAEWRAPIGKAGRWEVRVLEFLVLSWT